MTWASRIKRASAAWALTTLVLLVIANAFPILEFELNGRREAATVADGVIAFWLEQRYELALVVLAVVLLVVLGVLAALRLLVVRLVVVAFVGRAPTAGGGVERDHRRDQHALHGVFLLPAPTRASGSTAPPS